MPEMKRNFTGGKMNKDLDKRLVPPGEYRNAMNIQVSTSDDSKVGTAQNILGNSPGCVYVGGLINPVLEDSSTVGSISDESNNFLYWLVAGPSVLSAGVDTPFIPAGAFEPISFKDIIMRRLHDPSGSIYEACKPVLVDKYGYLISNDNYTDESTNFIQLDLNLLYNINTNMSVTGYSGQDIVFNDIPLTAVGNIAIPPLSYESIESIDPPIYEVTSYQVLIPLIGEMGETSQDPTVWELAPPQQFQGQDYLYIANTWDPNLNSPIDIIGPGNNPIGDTLELLPYSNLGNTQTFTILGAQNVVMNWDGADRHVVRLELSAPIADFTPPIDQFNSQPIALTSTDGGAGWPFYGPELLAGVTFAYHAEPSGFITCHRISTTVFAPVLTNQININEQDFESLPLVYNTFFDDVNQVGPTGLNLEINNSLGSGYLWPPNTCIAATSVVSIGDFGYDMVDCDSNLPVVPSNDSNGPLYFEVTGDNANNGIHLESEINLNAGGNTPVEALLFTSPRVLNFNRDNLITGINIIDDMLFWTDNFTEPKKINIPRSIAGTEFQGDTHTRVINGGIGLDIYSNVPLTEEHVTVIKKGPKQPLAIEFDTGRDPEKHYAGFMKTVVDPDGGVNQSSLIGSNGTALYNFGGVAIGDRVQFKINSDINSSGVFELEWKENDIVLLEKFEENGNPPPTPLSSYSIRARITGWQWNSFESDSGLQLTAYGADWPLSEAGSAHVEIEILSLNGAVPIPIGDELNFVVDLEPKIEAIFQNKFPRFSYRYKYADNEYSVFAPWSQVAFVPGSFNYDPKNGWNTGMINNVREITVKNFITNDLPKDVTEIDILYKEEASPNVYIVETINPLNQPAVNKVSNSWYLNKYTITSEAIKSTISSNQLLRPWDNVPKKALAQEVTGNRIVYGNYEQNININSTGVAENFKPNFKNYISTWENVVIDSPYKSIKSLRDYKLGVVFTDGYGRETPILISESGGFKINKTNSIDANRLVAGLDGQPPENVDYFKFFIKETSTEYYNLPMDRWYPAEDGNIWLAFPSSDRNKVDIDTNLFLKKGDSDAIENNSKYKVLAIENEAPIFIKTRKIRIGTVEHNSSRTMDQSNNIMGDVFGAGLTDAPRYNAISFNIGYDQGGLGSTSMSNLDDITEDLYIRFVGDGTTSSQYKINQVSSNLKDANVSIGDRSYYVTLDKPFVESDISFIFDSVSSPTKVSDGIRFQITKDVIENSPKFEGRFFVKIPNDGRIKLDINNELITTNYHEAASKMVYLLDNDATLRTRSSQAWFNNTTSTDANKYFGGVFPTNWIDNDYNPGSGEGELNNNNNADNPNGENWNRHNARQAFFGKTPLMPGYNPNGRWDVEFDPVWFINKSTQKYSVYYGGATPNQLYWAQAPGNQYSMSGFTLNAGSTGSGIINFSESSIMNLAVGGIGYKKYTDNWGLYETLYWSDQNYSALLPTFYGIGSDNSNYSDAATKEFVKRIDSGFSFWWKEDPTKTVYTVNGNNQTKWARWNRVDDGGYDSGGSNDEIDFKRKMLIGSPASYHKNWRTQLNQSMGHWDPAAATGTAMLNGLKLGDTVHPQTLDANQSAGNTLFNVDTSDLSIGMTVYNITTEANIPQGTIITNIDHDASEVTLNNAVLDCDNEEVEFGYSIRFVAHNNFVDPTDVWIEVDNIEAECFVNGGKYRIEKGMRLSSWDDGAFTAANAIVKEPPYKSDNGWKIKLTGYTHPLVPNTEFLGAGVLFTAQKKMLFEQVTMNSVSNNTEYNSDLWSDYWEDTDSGDNTAGVGAVGYTMVMLEPVDEYDDGGVLPPDPYVWETQPKDNADLDIYYEISENNPINLNSKTIKTVIPIGSTVVSRSGEGFGWHNNTPSAITITDNSGPGNVVTISQLAYIGDDPLEDPNSGYRQLPLVAGSALSVVQPTGVIIDVRIDSFIPDDSFPDYSNKLKLETSLYNSNYHLTWHNCYSFGNGVESNRIRDNFNLPFIANGVKASTTLDQEYKKERRKYGLIYSGLYNSTSGINNLNQFAAAEKITKDINPTYGSIQKLHARDSDLVALCEDKILKILSSKDALYNADGKPQLVATDNVLGQTIPFVGEYGISKNPESFASESYRAYFADKTRGAIIRLSKDGITPISDHGMKNWFRNNLKLTNKLIGSYDDKKDEYNITLKDNNITVTFKEDVRGWVSFKSFVPENAVSCYNEYYTFKQGNLWMHHNTFVDRNTFYGAGEPHPSSFKVILNDAPSVVKTFHTLNYEGSQAVVSELISGAGLKSQYDTFDANSFVGFDPLTGASQFSVTTGTHGDNAYYNLENKQGWYVSSIETNKEIGAVDEFIEKEGKWFNHIKGK